MLKQRAITGLLLAIVGYYFVTIASLTMFLLLEAFLFILVSLEWSKLAKFDTPIQKVTMSLVLLIGIAVLGYMPIYLFGIIVLSWWIFATYWVVSYQRGKIIWPSSTILLKLIGVMLVAPLFVSAYGLKHIDQVNDRHTLLFVIILIALCDVMAYFVGKTIGNHLLVSKVSPKKTWEGIVGGIVASGLLSVPVAYWCGVTDSVNPWMALPAIAIAGISVLGDLTESVCKRNAGIKDSGNILPGHGGILDRFDSYTAGVPIAYLLLHFIK